VPLYVLARRVTPRRPHQIPPRLRVAAALAVLRDLAGVGATAPATVAIGPRGARPRVRRCSRAGGRARFYPRALLAALLGRLPTPALALPVLPLGIGLTLWVEDARAECRAPALCAAGRARGAARWLAGRARAVARARRGAAQQSLRDKDLAA
jgi:hypothetical protein